MQLFILAVVLSIFAHDASVDLSDPASDQKMTLWPIAILSFLHLFLAVAYYGVCRMVYRRLEQPRVELVLSWLDRLTAVYRSTVLLFFMVGLWYGVLKLTRVILGDLILIDEFLTLIPPLGMIIWSWWSYYPIDKRLREAPLIRRLDTGLPVHSIWTRWQYLLFHVRHQIALMLVPLLALMALSELINRYVPDRWSALGIDLQSLSMVICSAMVFLIAPVVIRHLWATAPLPAGELRDRLMMMCRDYGVGIRELLLWDTFGGMVNGAVMGAISRVRYILLTDALLEALSSEEVEAVMAHELAHVKRHHIFWLVGVGVAAMAGLALGWAVIIEIIIVSLGVGGEDTYGGLIIHPAGQVICTGLLACVTWAVVFGWVSRRFERQADSFAVTHFATKKIGPTIEQPGTPVTIPRSAIEVMTRSLQQVADLNHLPTTRRSWRHGSIAWRQTYLRRLEGIPLGQLPIDRQVFAIKLAAMGTGIALVMLEWWQPDWLDALLG